MTLAVLELTEVYARGASGHVHDDQQPPALILTQERDHLAV